MSMQPVVFKVALFRGDWDQARSQYSLLWMMEALCRINQSHIRQFRGLAEKGAVPAPYPPLYRSGIHYEPEAGTEEWLDIPTALNVPGGTFPGPWADCLPVSTLVLRDDYEFVPIGALKPGDKIMAEGKWTQVLEQVVTGEKPILAFDLNNGSTLRCSPNHRLFLANGKEIRAEKVKPGDKLLTPRAPIPTGNEWKDEVLSPTDFAWLLGVHVADGWTDTPRHPRFNISGRDGKPKEEQKKRVKEIVERAGISTYWNERYIGVNDKRLSYLMATCGSHAPVKHFPSLAMSIEQVRAALSGLKADASIATSGTVTQGTTSPLLALQTRVLYRMLGQSVHIKRWDNHGGLGTHPIYRVTVRRHPDEYIDKKSEVRSSARVVSVREDGIEMCADIETEARSFWLPESDIVVHNCEDLACWRVAELREDPHHPLKAKPFAKWRRKPDGSYGYHALCLLPNGRIEDPSLILGMGMEPEFARLRMAQRYKEGSLTPNIMYAAKPDVVVVDPEKESGYGKDVEAAKLATGLTDVPSDLNIKMSAGSPPPPGAPINGLVRGTYPKGSPPVALHGFMHPSIRPNVYTHIRGDSSPTAAWGYDRKDVDESHMNELFEFCKTESSIG